MWISSLLQLELPCSVSLPCCFLFLLCNVNHLCYISGFFFCRPLWTGRKHAWLGVSSNNPSWNRFWQRVRLDIEVGGKRAHEKYLQNWLKTSESLGGGKWGTWLPTGMEFLRVFRTRCCSIWLCQIYWRLSIGSAWTSIGKDLGTCSEVLYFELTGERYMMTFLNVLNFGDQGKCDSIVEWWQSFLIHCFSCGSENDLKVFEDSLKIWECFKVFEMHFREWLIQTLI